MLTTLRHVTLLITSATVIYYFVLSHSEFRRTSVKRFEDGTRIKNIIGYSLRKQMEIDGEEISCENLKTVENNSVPLENHVWTKIPNTELFVYSAYLDERLSPYKYLRIIGMYKGNWNKTIYCQTVESNGRYLIMKSKNTDVWVQQWNKGDESTYNPVLISCQIQTNVSRLALNGKACEYVGNYFLIHHKNNLKPRKLESKRVTICVKPLNFEYDISDHLVQWIEINKIIGAEKIDIYVENVHENVERVLQWYQKNQSNVNVIRHSSITNTKLQEKNINHIKTSSGDTSSLSNVNDGDIKKIITDVTVNESVRKVWQKRRNELISYNDCFYRNLNATDFILPVDIDEIITSKRFYTWRHFLNDLLEKNPELGSYASLSVRNAYFFRDHSNNQSVFFFRDRTRGSFSAKDVSGKSFISTKNALTVFNHYALHVLRPGFSKVHFLSPDDAQMNHYRETCPMWLLPECKKYFYDTRRFNDTSVAKYEEEFNRNYGIILDQLKHIHRVT